MPSSGKGLGQNFLPSESCRTESHSSLLPWAGTLCTAQGCSKPHPTWPRTLRGMGQPPLLWATCAMACLCHSQEFLPKTPPQPAHCPFKAIPCTETFAFVQWHHRRLLAILDLCTQSVKSLGYKWKHPQWLPWGCREISQFNISQRNQMQQLFPFLNIQTSTELISAAAHKGASCFIPKSAWLWRKSSFLGNFLCWLKATG